MPEWTTLPIGYLKGGEISKKSLKSRRCYLV